MMVGGKCEEEDPACGWNCKCCGLAPGCAKASATETDALNRNTLTTAIREQAKQGNAVDICEECEDKKVLLNFNFTLTHLQY